ncbi:MAG: peptidylprolyl isomerase [Saprospiraceae bacterium]|nr:peptidylprolyl isomerase [Candidatus Opimibacter skivensis]
MRFSLILTLVSFFWTSLLYSQSGDPVLFTIDGQSVQASEFSYIYAKNNRDDADFTEKSLREYLDLYTKFKLKVREAYAMGLDTLPQLQTELAGYRKQLADSYLTDKEITDRLVTEAYNRMQEDIQVSHILIKTNPNAASDTMAAYTKIQGAYKRLQAGEAWDLVVKQTSEDNPTKETGGDLGYVTALLPNGFYAFESAAYETPVGKYSMPIRTTLGYHIVKVTNKRPARGELDIAHILLRVKADGSDDKAVKTRIDAVYAQLVAGDRFEEVAKTVSEDKATAERGGAIGPIAINQYERSFEDAVFALANDGDYTKPVRTRLGWHIIKRTRKRPTLTLEQAKRKIETQISRDERITSARQTMVARIKKDAGYSKDENVYNQFVSLAGADLQTYKWQVPEVAPATIMTLGGDKYTNIDFGNYIRNNARTRMGLAKGTPSAEIFDKVYTEFVNEKALFFEEKNLAEKYPEFKSLMREYEEGILLFEATKINVWDKASKDSTGLDAFHAAHRNDYMWDERLEVATVMLDSASMNQLATIKKWAAKKPLTVVSEKAAKKGIGMQVTRKVYQKEDQLPEGITWAAGQKADLPDGRGFVSVEKIIPPTPKTMDEARGYIIADYQDQLEKDWVASLQAKYPVKVDDAVLMSLVKK